MSTLTGHAPTEKASRYLQQLAKHWSHKAKSTFDAQKALIEFETRTLAMEAGEDKLLLTVTAADDADAEKFKGVVEAHIDRFAFREAPLAYSWD